MTAVGHRLYRCRVTHARSGPVRHRFTSPMWMLDVDLGTLDRISQASALVRHNAWGLLSLWDRDHLDGEARPLLDTLAELLRRDGVQAPLTRARLVTIPRVLGWTFNPVSFHYCYGDAGLIAVVVEIRNTYGEAHAYTLPAGEDRLDKRFFVSPFNGVEGHYRLSVPEPGEDLDLRVDLYVRDRLLIHTRLEGRGRPLNTPALLGTLARMPFAASLTLARISWQALRLERRGLSVRMKPRPVDPATRQASEGYFLTPSDRRRDARRRAR